MWLRQAVTQRMGGSSEPGSWVCWFWISPIWERCQSQTPKSGAAIPQVLKSQIEATSRPHSGLMPTSELSLMHGMTPDGLAMISLQKKHRRVYLMQGSWFYALLVLLYCMVKLKGEKSKYMSTCIYGWI